MGNYKGVIFDLDGVLVSTDECHFQAWKQLAMREEIPFTRKDNERLRGVSRMESLEIILEKARKEYSREEKQEMTDYKNIIYCHLLQSLSPEDVLPGVIRLLRQLKKEGFKLAVGSSSRNARLILDKTRLESYFDVIADGTQITRSKPDPEVFLLAANLLKLKPEDCIVVEDAEAGIQAAIAAGEKAVAVGSACGVKGAACSFRNLEQVELENFLKGVNETKENE